jgi:adenosylcobinamide amidohydrolase
VSDGFLTAELLAVELGWRTEDDASRPLLVMTPRQPMRSLSSAVLGGGAQPVDWIINAHVHLDYWRDDPDEHLLEMAAARGLSGVGVGLMTAANVQRYSRVTAEGVDVVTTVGISHPTWAAGPDGSWSESSDTSMLGQPFTPGTINIVAAVPVAMSDAAMVNLVMTMTEAKSQAMLELGIAGTGTASDAVCVLAASFGNPEPYGGPRSIWGARIARAVHQSILATATS